MLRLIKNIIALIQGAGLSKLILLLSTPIISRLYSPEEFSSLAVFTSFCLILTGVINLRYCVALPLADNYLVKGLILLCAFLPIIMVILASPIIYFFIYVYFESNLYIYLLLFFTLIFQSYNESLIYMATRSKDFTIVRNVQVGQSFLGSAIKVIFGYLSLGGIGLVVGQSISQTAGFFSLAKKYKNEILDAIRLSSIDSVLLVAKKYLDFPKFRLPANILMTLSQQLPMLAIPIYYGVNEAGNFGLAMMTFSVPIQLVAKSVSKALYAEVARINNKDRIITIINNITLRLSIVAIPSGFIFFGLGSTMVTTVFGDNWVLAGEILSILSLGFIANFIFSPTLEVLNVVSNQKDYMIFYIFRLVLVSILLLAGFLSVSFKNYIVLLSIINFSSYTLGYLLVRYRLR